MSPRALAHARLSKSIFTEPSGIEAARRGAGVKIVGPLIKENEQNLAYAGAGLLEMLSDAVERDLSGFTEATSEREKPNGERLIEIFFPVTA